MAEKNYGRNPFQGNDDPPYIDIKFRNNIKVLHVLPSQYRWKQWDTGPHAFDITAWRISEAKDYEVVFPSENSC